MKNEFFKFSSRRILFSTVMASALLAGSPQAVFGGTSNALDFLPLDRSGNRRFIPVMVYPEQAEVHILEDEAASRAYIEQMWAEAMEIYRSGRFKLAFSPAMQRYLKEHQRDFMPEDTKAGMIQAYLDKYTGETVCSKQLYKEALNQIGRAHV